MKLRHKAALTVSIILSAWNAALSATGIFLCIYLFNCWKTCVFFIKTPTNTQTTATTTKQSHQFGYSYRIWSSCLPSNPIRDIRSYLRVWLEVVSPYEQKNLHICTLIIVYVYYTWCYIAFLILKNQMKIYYFCFFHSSHDPFIWDIFISLEV